MKYKYGVEYETNGEKPDLPDDVLVRTQGDDGECLATYRVMEWNWSAIKKFRIVDERYKPASDTNVGSNWHDRGEFPPVGTAVEYSCLYRDGKEFIEPGQWYSGEIIAYHDGFVWTSDNGLRMINNTKFRPLQSERDVLVEKAADAMRGTEVNLTGSHLQVLSRQLIDAGWRPAKQQSEAEFVSECAKFMNLRNYDWATQNALCEIARYIHRAGCRFVEQGVSNEEI